MYESARLALGTVQQNADPRPLIWGLLNEIKRRDWEVQPLFTRASYQDPGAIQSIACPTPTTVAARSNAKTAANFVWPQLTSSDSRARR